MPLFFPFSSSIWHSLETPVQKIYSLPCLLQYQHFLAAFPRQQQTPVAVSSPPPLHFHKFTDCRCPYCIAKCHLSSLHTLNRRLCVSNFICAWHVIQGRIWLMLDDRDLDAVRIPPSLLTAPSPRALHYTLDLIPHFPAVLLLLLDQDGCLPTQFVVK